MITNVYIKNGIHKRSTGCKWIIMLLQLANNHVISVNLGIFLASSSEAMQELPPYVLLAQRRSLYQLSLDGTRKRTVVDDTFSDILAMDYHYRYILY